MLISVSNWVLFTIRCGNGIATAIGFIIFTHKSGVVDNVMLALVACNLVVV